jgi:hypothetical protein
VVFLRSQLSLAATSLSCPAHSLVHVQKSSTELSDEFGRVSSLHLTTVRSSFPSRRTGMSKTPAPAL